MMYVEELLYRNIPSDERDKILFMSITLDILDEFRRGQYDKSGLDMFVKGSRDMSFELSNDVYNSTLNYRMDFQLPTRKIGKTIGSTLEDIKEITKRKRNKGAMEYLLGYKEDEKLCLLKNSEEDKWLKEIIYENY